MDVTHRHTLVTKSKSSEAERDQTASLVLGIMVIGGGTQVFSYNSIFQFQ